MNECRGLWRGKRVDNGEWGYGDLICSRYSEKSYSYSISGRRYTDFCVDVDPSTLGECTGLCDKNGKHIFEGDIVKYSSRYKQCVGEILFSGNQCRFIMRLGSGQVFEVARKYANCYEIIGNIHDNPELLQKGAAE